MDFSPAIQLIEKAKHIGLVLPASPSHDVLASAEVIIRFLASRDIYVGIITRLDLALLKPDTVFPALTSLKPLTKEFIISLNTAAAPISQLRYEHVDNRVDIILSPSSYSILQDSTSFRQGNIQCDCVIALGIDDIKQIDTAILNANPSFFSDIPIITLDISQKHAAYGRINLVDSSLSSLAELTYYFLTSFPHYVIPAENATLLLSGILHHTRNFTLLANANTLLISHELIGLGANNKTAHDLSRTSTPFSLMPLIGRALARSRMDERKEVVWSCITQSDFLATGHLPKDTIDVLHRMRKEFPHTRACVLLWQYPDSKEIRVSIAADEELLEDLREKTHGEYSETHAELADTHDSFPHAEYAITALLDSVL
jgi:nanoRNase/pAp phosphatase (c-di-AMP/oligoRNAs hydrolase)